MININSKKGLATNALIGIIATVVIIGGAVYFILSNTSEAPENSAEVLNGDNQIMNGEEGAMMDKDGNIMMDDPSTSSGQTGSPQDGDGAMMDSSAGSPLGYSGEVLAGTKAKLLDFNKADFDAAIKTDKLIVLYFYADWCPICKAEFPKMQSAFNELNTDEVVAFRVNYKDDFTDKDEENLAKDHGVAYQHTKVFIQNGERVLKALDSWEESRYLTEIEKFVSLN